MSAVSLIFELSPRRFGEDYKFILNLVGEEFEFRSRKSDYDLIIMDKSGDMVGKVENFYSSWLREEQGLVLARESILRHLKLRLINSFFDN